MAEKCVLILSAGDIDPTRQDIWSTVLNHRYSWRVVHSEPVDLKAAIAVLHEDHYDLVLARPAVSDEIVAACHAVPLLRYEQWENTVTDAMALMARCQMMIADGRRSGWCHANDLEAMATDMATQAEDLNRIRDDRRDDAGLLRLWKSLCDLRYEFLNAASPFISNPYPVPLTAFGVDGILRVDRSTYTTYHRGIWTDLMTAARGLGYEVEVVEDGPNPWARFARDTVEHGIFYCFPGRAG